MSNLKSTCFKIIFSQKHIKILLFIIHYLLFISNSNAQEFSVSSSIDTNKILIGEQFNFTIRAKAKKGYQILWQDFIEEIQGFEIVARSGFDTLAFKKSKEFQIEETYTLTHWDSGFYVLEPLYIYFQNQNKIDSQQTEPFVITVQTVAVDTSKSIRDIKPTMEVPITFMEILPWILLVLGILILVGIIIFLVIYFNKKTKNKLIENLPKIPPHQIALEKLAKLEANKLWQSGEIKPFYSELTEILRIYIEGIFEIPALESTTDEIMDGILTLNLPKEIRNNLRNLLMDSDLVKFAKSHPLPEDNIKYLREAEDFIRNTKHFYSAPTT